MAAYQRSRSKASAASWPSCPTICVTRATASVSRSFVAQALTQRLSPAPASQSEARWQTAERAARRSLSLTPRHPQSARRTSLPDRARHTQASDTSRSYSSGQVTHLDATDTQPSQGDRKWVSTHRPPVAVPVTADRADLTHEVTNRRWTVGPGEPVRCRSQDCPSGRQAARTWSADVTQCSSISIERSFHNIAIRQKVQNPASDFTLVVLAFPLRAAEETGTPCKPESRHRTIVAVSACHRGATSA